MFTSRVSFLAVLGALLASPAQGIAEPPALASPPLNVLLLGDQGPHRPAERARQLLPVLESRGIQVHYTEALADLEASNLRRYQALIIFANIERIETQQERALLDFVSSGGGLVALHCASFCFQNSPDYVRMVGARFASHGTGEFEAVTVDAKHPITRGLTPLKTWDETYVHRDHNPHDRQVLQVRRHAGGEEPWTWIRRHGQGRVFYTAFGHDARTWGHPGFHALVERGIRWAAGDDHPTDGTPRLPTGAPAFRYEPADLPNYLPGEKWGTQGEPISQMQLPLTPSDSMRLMVLPSSQFKLELFVAEPDIARPLAMAWDHRGRLWVAESVDYPNDLQPLGQGHDRITICEDTDGDGRADRFTRFAENLSIPTSLLCVGSGLIVQQAPHTLLLQDTDGDDRADVRRVLFTGWGTRDTHAGPSNLRYGFDNWIYGIVGYSGFDGEVAGAKHKFGAGIYRFRPDGAQLEFLRSTNNNSWGLGFSEEGHLFGSTANNCPSVYLPIANRYYESVRGWAPMVLQSIAPWNRYFPVTDKVRQMDWHGGFTAAAGHALYTARAYPSHYWNRAAFITEPTGHLAATFLLEPRGADFVAHHAWNLAASFDEWTSPIAAEVGPDGHVWMIDWYNYIIQHNPTPQGFKTGKGNAYETDLRDKTHGRVYRAVYQGAAKPAISRLDPGKAEQLVQALTTDNLFWRLTAQRLLVERGKSDIVAKLTPLVANQQQDSTGLSPGPLHAIWTLAGLGALADPQAEPHKAVVAALRHVSPAVRRNALAALPPSDVALQAIVSSGIVNDSDAQVRLAALLALAEMPPGTPAAVSIAEALSRGENTTDRWLTDALIAAGARNDRELLLTLSKEPPAEPARVRPIASQIAEHYARGTPVDSVGVLLAALPNAEEGFREAVVLALARGWPRERSPALNQELEDALFALAGKLSPEPQGALVAMATRWGSQRLKQFADELNARGLATLRSTEASDADRVAAAQQLVTFARQSPDLPIQVLAVLSPKISNELARGLVDAVSQSEVEAVGAALVERLAVVTPAVRPKMVAALVGRPRWTAALLAAIEAGQVQLAELSLDQKQALAAHPDKRLAERATKLLAASGGLPDADRQRVIDELAPRVTVGGDAARGKAVFKEHCSKCHKHSGEGTQIGPDLTGMAVHPKHELLVHVLDPSRSVEGNFYQYSVITDDGLSLVGLLAAETKTTIELVAPDGKSQTLLRENIEQLVATRKSLMPEGFEKQLSPAELADLLEFLALRGRYLPLDLRKVATAISTRGMFYDAGSDVERLIFADWSPKTFEGVPFHLVDPQGDRVANVVLLHGPQGVFPPRMPKSVSLEVNAPAAAIHLLSGVSGWGYAGSPQPPTVSLIVRLRYADGAAEDHPLEDGVHFADYIRPVEVPGSKLAFRLRGQQIRYLAVRPQRADPIRSIELVKGPDATAPVVMAVTVETR